MDDLISRAKTLNMVEKLYRACEGSLSDYHDLLVVAIMDLQSYEDTLCKKRDASISEAIDIWEIPYQGRVDDWRI